MVLKILFVLFTILSIWIGTEIFPNFIFIVNTYPAIPIIYIGSVALVLTVFLILKFQKIKI